jgi:hypothetical protein
MIRKRVIGIPILYAGGLALAYLALVDWNSLLYAKGKADAWFNLSFGDKTVHAYRLWETYSDTAELADSLVYASFGLRVIEDDPKIRYDEAARSYAQGYESVYVPYLREQVFPLAYDQARAILRIRPRPVHRCLAATPSDST